MVEVVFGNSLYVSLKNSSLKDNNIILFNTLFSVSDLSKVNDYMLDININIECFKDTYVFKEQMYLLD